MYLMVIITDKLQFLYYSYSGYYTVISRMAYSEILHISRKALGLSSKTLIYVPILIRSCSRKSREITMELSYILSVSILRKIKSRLHFITDLPRTL